MTINLQTDDPRHAQAAINRVPRADRAMAFAETLLDTQPRDTIIKIVMDGLPQWRKSVKRSHVMDQSFFTDDFQPDDIDAIWRYLRNAAQEWKAAFTEANLPRG